MGKLKKNYLYSVSYQILAIIIPLITLPYVSRVIGSTGVGEYNYTYSIVYYFMIAAILGINNYGTREIAKVNDNKEKLNNKFWSIYFSQILTSFLVFVTYIIFVVFINRNYESLFVIQTLYIISCFFDLGWFFNGLEEVKITVTRNTLIKFISLLLIFIFVKDKNDTGIYTLILSGSTLLSNIYLFFQLRKYVNKPVFNYQEILSHLYPSLILFIPVIAMKIYKVMDKTMLGIMNNSISNVGIYSNSESIINVPMGIIIALGNVMLPRLTALYSKKENEKAIKLFYKSFKIALFISFPVMVGLGVISDNLAITFFGNEFKECGNIIKILCPTIIFMTISNVIRTQFLIPNAKDRQYIIAIIAGAIANFIFNIIFIPKLGVLGACYGTLLAEFIVMVFHIKFANNDLKIVNNILINGPIILKSFAMGISIYFLKYAINSNFILMSTQIIIGCLIYFILNYKYILSELNLKKVFLSLVNRKVNKNE